MNGESRQRVFVLVPSAVYDHDVIGVYATEQDARAAAEALWPQTDGHHRFTIRPREIGVTYDVDFTKAWPWHEKQDPGPAHVELHDEPPASSMRTTGGTP